MAIVQYLCNIRIKDAKIGKAFVRRSVCLYTILKHLALASIGNSFAYIRKAFSRKCQNNRNLFVSVCNGCASIRSSELSADICKVFLRKIEEEC